MAIQAEAPGGTFPPFAKLTNLGDEIIGAYTGGVQRQQRKFGTTDYAYKPDGKPLNEFLFGLVAMPGIRAATGRADETLTPIEAGTHVCYVVSGFKWGQLINARRNLPAYAGFKAGTPCSGDIYTVRLTGWSAATDNPQGAVNVGLTVVDGRIVMRDEASHEKWVLAQIKKGANTNAAKDYEISIRRPGPGDHEYEKQADELFLSKWWEGTTSDLAPVGGGSSMADQEPFLDLGDRTFNFRDMHRFV